MQICDAAAVDTAPSDRDVWNIIFSISKGYVCAGYQKVSIIIQQRKFRWNGSEESIKMKSPHSIRIFLRRRLEYIKYLLGLYKSEHVFNPNSVPERISILIPDSLGDIAINSSVTQYFKSCFPKVEITLITHPKYINAGYFDPCYDRSLQYPPEYLELEPWALTYKNQVDIARTLTPDMDRLYLCQPSSWCDHLVTKHTMLDLQNRLCNVASKKQFMPKLQLPADSRAKAEQFQSGLKNGLVLLISREAYTANYDKYVTHYWNRIVEYCIENGFTVLDNSKSPAVVHPDCIAVGEMPLADVVALAGLCDGVMALRSGLCDLIGFSVNCRQYIIYPVDFYPFSRMTFLSWASLCKMGVNSVVEYENSFKQEIDVEIEFQRSREWLRSFSIK
jgi:hypothetical protein